MSKSSTITDTEEWLENPHAGDILASEYMEPLGLSATRLAAAIDVTEARIGRMIEGSEAVDAGLDIRLGRYFGLSEGFFLRLQNAFALEEAKRAHGAEFARIQRRAA